MPPHNENCFELERDIIGTIGESGLLIGTVTLEDENNWHLTFRGQTARITFGRIRTRLLIVVNVGTPKLATITERDNQRHVDDVDPGNMTISEHMKFEL